MDNFLNNGAEKLADALKTNSNTKAAFQSVAEVIEEILDFVEGQNKETTIVDIRRKLYITALVRLQVLINS